MIRNTWVHVHQDTTGQVFENEEEGVGVWDGNGLVKMYNLLSVIAHPHDIGVTNMRMTGRQWATWLC